MNLRRAIEKLGIRQKAYKSAFGVVGSPAYLALIDLADFCAAFQVDPFGLNHDGLMQMIGRRQAFFRVFNHLKLSPTELETVYRGAVLRAAERLADQGEAA